uniref:Monodehydroascorbate reductase n=1 Tax=Tanacetum cinerariifolium TaxID=118510 RepID=A0A699GVU9_TANCI|nr:hypothetical protein [Tanacetum cinerariifolium]
MDMKIDQQVALDEALVPHASRLRIGKSNFCLRSDITSKESTLQVVYDVLRLTSFYKAFLVTSDVHEIYMQEFWATAIVHHHFFKMNNKKRIVNLEYFREMLHICPRIPNQTFDELPFEEEILAFLRYLGHSGEIKKITDVNINNLHQPWRSFAAVINKCLSGKSTGYDSLWLSQAQILWGMYHKKNVDFAYLLWEDFVYQVEQKYEKRVMRCTTPGLQKDDQMFTTIKLVSRHQNTQKFGAILPVELTNEDIRNSAAYKKYYAIASGAAPPETKASVRKTQSSSDTTITPPIAAGTRLSTSAKGKQPAKSSKAKDDDDEVDDQSDDECYDDQEDDDHDDNDDDQDLDNDGDDLVHPSLGMNVGGDEGSDAGDDDDELYGDLNINLEDMLNPRPDAGIDSLFESTPRVDVQVTTTVAPLPLTALTRPPSFIPTIFQFVGAASSIPNIVDRYINHQMNEAVKVAVQIQSDRLRDEAQAENEDFLNKLDENIQKIIKEQVKVQVFKILPKIEKTVNEQLEAEVLTRSSNSSNTSYAMAADLSELELKKILIGKIESNKDTVTLKRRRNDTDKDEEPLVGSDLGSKRRREGKEPESTSAPKEKASKTTGAADDQPIAEASQHPEWESARDVYSKRKIIVVTELQIVEWHNYKHLDWITVRRDDDKIYKFKEGDLKRLRIQDIEDMLLLLVQEELTNLTVEERFAFNVSLRMFTRSIVIQRRVEDLQLGVESYQKKLNLTKPDTYSDGTLSDVRSALDDRLKGIQMKYFSQTTWRRSDKERAAAMIQAIDKQLKTRRIMRSREKFVGGRLYEGDFRMLQRTI